MKRRYDDILEIAGEPLWYDDNGVPRYVSFKPQECGSYMQSVALILLACDTCGNTFRVSSAIPFNSQRQISKSFQEQVIRVEQLLLSHDGEKHILLESIQEALLPKSDDIQVPIKPSAGNLGDYSYGDLPRHNCFGEAVPLRVLEFWERTASTSVNSDEGLTQVRVTEGNGGWKRYEQYEVSVKPNWAQKYAQ